MTIWRREIGRRKEWALDPCKRGALHACRYLVG
jgi:hypothetical protein